MKLELLLNLNAYLRMPPYIPFFLKIYFGFCLIFLSFFVFFFFIFLVSIFLSLFNWCVRLWVVNTFKNFERNRERISLRKVFYLLTP